MALAFEVGVYGFGAVVEGADVDFHDAFVFVLGDGERGLGVVDDSLRRSQLAWSHRPEIVSFHGITQRHC